MVSGGQGGVRTGLSIRIPSLDTTPVQAEYDEDSCHSFNSTNDLNDLNDMLGDDISNSLNSLENAAKKSNKSPNFSPNITPPNGENNMMMSSDTNNLEIQTSWMGFAKNTFMNKLQERKRIVEVTIVVMKTVSVFQVRRIIIAQLACFIKIVMAVTIVITAINMVFTILDQ